MSMDVSTNVKRPWRDSAVQFLSGPSLSKFFGGSFRLLATLRTSTDLAEIHEARKQLLDSQKPYAVRAVQGVDVNRLRPLLEQAIERIREPFMVWAEGLKEALRQGVIDVEHERQFSENDPKVRAAAAKAGLIPNEIYDHFLKVQDLLGWYLGLSQYRTLGLESSIISALEVNISTDKMLNIFEGLAKLKDTSAFNSLPTAIEVLKDADLILDLFKCVDGKWNYVVSPKGAHTYHFNLPTHLNQRLLPFAILTFHERGLSAQEIVQRIKDEIAKGSIRFIHGSLNQWENEQEPGQATVK